MTKKLKGLVKLVKTNEYIGISDWKGQFAWISWTDIIKSHPSKNSLVQWQEVYLILKDTANINWKEDNPKYFNEYTYNQNTIPAPLPIASEFLDTPQQPTQARIQDIPKPYYPPNTGLPPVQQEVSMQNDDVINILNDIKVSIEKNNSILINIRDFLLKDYKPKFVNPEPEPDESNKPKNRLPQVVY